MFKKRMRLAIVVFAVILVMTAVSVVFLTVTARKNGVETEAFVLHGDMSELEGVTLDVFTVEGVRLDDIRCVATNEMLPEIDTYHQIRTFTVSDGLLQNGLAYEKGDGTEIVNRYFTVIEVRKNGESSCELTGEAYNGFYRYFDVPNFEYLTWRVKDYFDGTSVYTHRLSVRIELSELDGGIYGYIGLEPVYKERYSEQIFTVNKGIYRFFEDGTTEFICPMGTLAEDFSFLWMIPKEEEKALTVVGMKGNDLVAYIYSLADKTIEEKILWKSEGEVKDWYGYAVSGNLADICFVGDKVYLGYASVATGWFQVEMIVFEDGNRVFEGELLKEEFGYHPLSDFSMRTNEENEVDSVPEKIKISVKSK